MDESQKTIVADVMHDIIKVYGDRYPQSIIDSTEKHLTDFIVTKSNKAMYNEDMEDNDRHAYAFACGQAYMMGYAIGLDSDFSDEETDTTALNASKPVLKTVNEFIRQVGDRYPHKMINRMTYYINDVLDMYDTPEEDEFPPDFIRLIASSSLYGMETGEHALENDSYEHLPENDSIRQNLVFGTVTAMWEDTVESMGQEPEAHVLVDESTGDTRIINLMPDTWEAGEFDYDSKSGTVTCTFDADDVPDLVTPGTPNDTISVIDTYLLSKKYGILDFPEVKEQLQFVEDEVNDIITTDPNEELDEDEVLLIQSVGMLTPLIESLDDYVSREIINPSAIYSPDFQDTAIEQCAEYARGFNDAVLEYADNLVNEYDDTLPEDFKCSNEPETHIVDEVRKYCSKRGLKDWVYVSSAVYAINTVNDNSDELNTGVEESLGIGYADGVEYMATTMHGKDWVHEERPVWM